MVRARYDHGIKVRTRCKHYLKNDLKYKHSGATGKLPVVAMGHTNQMVVGGVSIEANTVYYGSNSTAMSAGSPPQSSQAGGPAQAPAPASPPLGRSQWSYQIMVQYMCRYQWYNGTMYHGSNGTIGTMVPWYHTMVW
jgi:hypothetical protein